MFTTRVFAAAAASVFLLAGCSRDVTGTAVTAAGAGSPTPSSGDGQCTTVTAPLEDIPAVDDGEPALRIPIPAGWERNATMDSQIIRYAIVAQGLAADGFAPNAVVTLESVRGSQDADIVFDQNRANLQSGIGATDLETVSNTTCGLPSETTDYLAPPMGPAPARPIIMHAVVATTEQATYLATLTIQTTDPDNPAYTSDAEQIVDGFQMLVP